MAPLTSKQKDPFTGYPRGWFVIGFTDELAIGGIQKLKYFGQEMVLFRGEDGKARLLDAFCPHLGAHLGANSQVIGNTIECPFHAWRFDGDGKCVEIPYTKNIPKKACVRGWKLSETNGLIHVWHHPRGGTPDWELPVISQWEDAQWTRWTPSILNIKSHPKEVMENVVDSAHFAKVHSTNVQEFENEFRDHLAIQKLSALAFPKAGGQDQFTITATYHGPGFQISEMFGAMDSVLVNAHTPVDDKSFDLRFGMMLRKVASDDKMAKYADMYNDNLRIGFHEDISIWENKLYREVPVLCDKDGPIMKLRKWYAQFYDNPEPTVGLGRKPSSSSSSGSSSGVNAAE